MSATPETDKHAFHRITGLASRDGDVVSSKICRRLEQVASYLAKCAKDLEDAQSVLAIVRVMTDDPNDFEAVKAAKNLPDLKAAFKLLLDRKNKLNEAVEAYYGLTKGN